jgi:two-component system, NarL family, sensor kinase
MTELDLLLSAIRNIKDRSELLSDRFLALTQSLGVSVVFCDELDRLVEFNEPALKLFALTAHHARGRRLGEFLGDPGRQFLQHVRVSPENVDIALLTTSLQVDQGAPVRVAVYGQLLRGSDIRALPCVMLLLVPAHRRDVLAHAVTHAGSREDYLANFLLLAREDERKRIASDLHDGLGQILTMLKLKVEGVLLRLDAQGQEEESRTALREVVMELKGAVGEVRRISNELRPSMLDDLGLLPTVQWLVRQFGAAYPAIQVTLDGQVTEDALPVTLKAVVFRLLQEAMSNVARHARASHVQVYLRVDEGMFTVGIEDNGSGFDANGVLSGKTCLLGVGLNSMRERVQASGGAFNIRSQAGWGTSVTAVWGRHDHVFINSRPSPLEWLNSPEVTWLELDIDLTR